MRPEHFTSMDLFDITIIGGGPVGLFAAYYAGLRGMRTKLIDILPELGGQLTALYPEKFIYDVAGFPKILARDLATNLIEQALQYRPSVFLGEHITTLKNDETDGISLFRLATAGGSEHLTRSLLITAGIGAFTPKRHELPAAREFEGKGVIYFVREKKEISGKKVLIVGGGDSAVDWALNLVDAAGSITIAHRSDQFRAHADNIRKLQQSPVSIRTFTQLSGITGNSHVEHATLAGIRSGIEETIDVDVILLCLGFLASIGPMKDWGLVLERNDIVVNSRMGTNIPGIFAAGDIATYPGKLKLIATGFGEATIAVNSAKTFIDPQAKYFPGHSSDLKNEQ